MARKAGPFKSTLIMTFGQESLEVGTNLGDTKNVPSWNGGKNCLYMRCVVVKRNEEASVEYLEHEIEKNEGDNVLVMRSWLNGDEGTMMTKYWAVLDYFLAYFGPISWPIFGPFIGPISWPIF